YGVLVHSLKSTSKMIGIMDLYETAAQMEKAADEADEKTIEEKHSAMMERYDKVTELIGKTIGEVTGEGSKDGGDASDDEVLEFLPQ
nr:Hpt domain-containing protein [Lachnospiraceae bacterium]